jgi:hypothetical protein
MKTKHFSTQEDAEGARDLRLALAWIAATLITGVAANIFVVLVSVAR